MSDGQCDRKEAFVRANAVLQMTLKVRKTSGAPFEWIALGPGIEIFRSNQRNAPQFQQMLDNLRQEGVDFAVCSVALENLGLTQDQRFPARTVGCGIEIANRIGEGYEILTF